MKIIETPLPGVILIEPKVHGDDRGFFMETFHAKRFEELRLPTNFVQDNYSRSVRNTLRGLHYQDPFPQGKLIRVTRGCVFDAAVDIRKESPSYLQWYGCELSEENKRMLWIPPGFAHGFCVLSDIADFSYKCTEFYNPETEHTILWNDPAIGISWPIDQPILSAKDAAGERINL